MIEQEAEVALYADYPKRCWMRFRIECLQNMTPRATCRSDAAINGGIITGRELAVRPCRLIQLQSISKFDFGVNV